MAAACLLAVLSACADQWLEAPPAPEGPSRCGPGTVLDTRQGLCVPAGCASDDDCAPGQICDPLTAACVADTPPAPPEPPACNEGAARCGIAGGRERCLSGAWVADACPDGSRCSGGECLSCVQGTRRCAPDGSAAYEICSALGAWSQVACAADAWCAEGRCRSCEPGAARCGSAGREVCDYTGTRWVPAACGDGERCAPEAGAACVPLACVPGSASCHPADPARRLVCAADGSAVVDTPCPNGTTCREPNGMCLDPCGLAAVEGQGAGCDYWFTHLANGTMLRNPARSVTVRVSNPGKEPARVRVSLADGAVVAGDLAVQPGGVAELPLPWRAPDGTALAGAAFHLESTAPVIAHESSLVEGEDRSRCIADGCWEPPCAAADACARIARSSGATLLLPTHLLGSGPADARYLVWSPRHQHEVLPAPALLAVVATREDTKLTIDFTAYTEASVDLAVAAYAPGDRGEFRLGRGQVLQLATARAGDETTWYGGEVPRSESANDFTGTRIVATAPVAVFTGADVGYVPLEGKGSDHLEEQLPPLALWGRQYVATRRSATDRFTLLVGDHGANVALSAPATAKDGSTFTVLNRLPPGFVLGFAATADFQLQSDREVLLVQTTGRASDGADPALLVPAPAERYRSRYDVRVPPGRRGQLHLVGPRAGADGGPIAVSVEGKAVAGWTFLPGTQMQVARVDLCAGPGTPCDPEGMYTVLASEPVGLTVHESGDGFGSAWVGGLGDDVRSYRPPSY